MDDQDKRGRSSDNSVGKRERRLIMDKGTVLTTVSDFRITGSGGEELGWEYREFNSIQGIDKGVRS